jgi:nucleotide-binding universal stress UspA family protein
MTRPIVVAVSEGDEARHAVTLGVAAARLLGAPLVLAGVVVATAPAGATVVPGWGPAADPTALRDYVRRELLRQADAVPDDVPCTVQVALATGVLAGLEVVVADEGAQLLVVGASHLGPLARSVRGDIAAGAARHAGCAVLVAPAAEDGDGADAGAVPRRIGVGWDGTPPSDAALELAVALADRGGGRLAIVRACEPADAADARRALDEVAERCAERVPTDAELRIGAAAGALVVGSEDLDLLVVGARRRSGVAALSAGSVSAPVRTHARCPVLVVPQGAPAPVPA